MKPLFGLQLDNQAVIVLVVGLMTAVFVLVLTLNLMATTIVLLMSGLALVLQKSYSRGWLFLLSVLLLFPSVKINQEGALFNDLLLACLALLGLVNLVIVKFKFPENNLFYEFFLLSLCGFSILSFGYILNQEINYNIWRITITVLLTWVVLVAFQYYFQTLKRIRRFLFVLFLAGLLHSAFGLIMYMGNWQTSSGLGISYGKTHNLLLGNIDHQINGFLGLGLSDRLKSNPLAPLLMVSLTITAGFILVERLRRQEIKNQQLPFELATRQAFFTEGTWLNKLLERLKEKIIALEYYFRKELTKREAFFYSTVVIQALALFFTLSEPSIIFLSIGLLAFGILDRNKRLMGLSSAVIIIFALIFPSLDSSITDYSSRNFKQWFEGFEIVWKNRLLGAGWRSLSPDASNISEKIHNSYLYIWNHFGLVGLGVFLMMLVKYFKDLYLGYIKSDGEKRIWLMVILAIFIELALEAMRGNSLIYGPAALVFWLLYGAAMNLRRKPVIHGLTETKLLDL